MKIRDVLKPENLSAFTPAGELDPDYAVAWSRLT